MHKLTVSGAILVAACGGGGNGGGGGWVMTEGTFSGVPASLLVDGPRVVLGSSEGIFISTDDGATWEASSDGLPTTGDFVSSIIPIYALLKIPDRLVAGGYVGAYRSDDDGASWADSSTGLPTTVSVYAMWWTGSSALMGFNATAPEGVLFRSVDNGESWVSFSSGLPNEQTVAFAQIDDTIYGAVPSAGVSRSSDDGQTWQVSPIPVPSNVLCLTANGDTLFAGTADAGIFKSTDGQAWSAVNEGFSAEDITTTLFAHQGVVYAGTHEHGVFRSSDDGASWELFSEGLDIDVPDFYYRVHGFAADDDTLFMFSELNVWRTAL